MFILQQEKYDTLHFSSQSQSNNVAMAQVCEYIPRWSK